MITGDSLQARSADSGFPCETSPTFSFCVGDQCIEGEVEGGVSAGIGQRVQLIGDHLKLLEKFVLENSIVTKRWLLSAPRLDLFNAGKWALRTRCCNGFQCCQAVCLQTQMMPIKGWEERGFDPLGVLPGEGTFGC